MMNRVPHDKRERGIMLVMFAITVPSLLGLSALALDAGNLYLTRLRLNKAVREVSGTALSMVALQGWSGLVQEEGAASGACVVNGANLCGSRSAKSATADHPSAQGPATQQILNAMQSAATRALGFPECGNNGGDNDDSDDGGDDNRGNQKCRFYSGNTPTGTGFGTDAITLSGQTSVNVRIEYDTPTLLAGAMGEILDGFGAGCTDGRCTVSSAPTTQSGNLRPANVYLLLDTSGSMSESASDGSVFTKKDRLTEAASSFIDMFNPSKDRVAIIQYSNAANTIRPLSTFEQSGTSENTLQVKEAIATLETGGMTNPCDALLETINSVPANNTDPTFVVLFTDGAPNVYRMNFCGDNGNCNSNMNPPKLKQKSNDNDGWYGWTVNWGERDTYCTEGSMDPVSGRECDPFFSYPKVLREDGTLIPYEQVAGKLILNSAGQFELSESTEERLQLVFKEKPTPNYKDFGPSYLVHASERNKLIDPDITIIDRIPAKKNDGTVIDTPITCGPGSADATLNLPNPLGSFPDNFNHARYFASRVLDDNWKLNKNHRDIDPPGQQMRDVLGLSKFASSSLPNRIYAPPYFPDVNNGLPPSLRRPFLRNGLLGNGCVKKLSGFLPFGAGNIFLGKDFVSNKTAESIHHENPDGSIGGVGEIVKSAELPYYCAIRAADALRTRNVRIFTIGLGTPASAIYDTDQTACNDPMENALDLNSRKDKFLTRLALDPRALANPRLAYEPGTISSGWNENNSFGYRTASIQCSNHPLNGESIDIGYGEAGTPKNPTSWTPQGHGFTRNNVGTYYGSNDPSQLRGIFAQVAKQILLELSL